ncbi:MAG: class I SAM-dependent methyltransferase, partial [Halobacteriota archaeon]
MNEAGDDAMDDAVDTAEASVRETYDRIADHFATTREYPWPEVETFVDETLDSVDGADGSSPLAIDLGCGNGRHTQLLAERGVEV